MLKGWWYFYLASVVFSLTFAFTWLLVENMRVDEYIEFAVYFDGLAQNCSNNKCAMIESSHALNFCYRYEIMRLEILPLSFGYQKAKEYDRICEGIKNRTYSIIGESME